MYQSTSPAARAEQMRRHSPSQLQRSSQSLPHFVDGAMYAHAALVTRAKPRLQHSPGHSNGRNSNI